jgi:hypothetical protein
MQWRWMEMDGGMKESQYFHSLLPCWSEANLLFHESSIEWHVQEDVQAFDIFLAFVILLFYIVK